MGGCQNDGPFWGTLNIRCRIIKTGPIVLTKTLNPKPNIPTVTQNLHILPFCTKPNRETRSPQMP